MSFAPVPSSFTEADLYRRLAGLTLTPHVVPQPPLPLLSESTSFSKSPIFAPRSETAVPISLRTPFLLSALHNSSAASWQTPPLGEVVEEEVQRTRLGGLHRQFALSSASRMKILGRVVANPAFLEDSSLSERLHRVNAVTRVRSGLVRSSLVLAPITDYMEEIIRMALGQSSSSVLIYKYCVPVTALGVVIL